MQALQQVEKLIGEMKQAARVGANLEKYSDQILLLCRAHMTPEIDLSGREYGFTPSEMRIFQFLAAHKGRCVTKGQLLDAARFDYRQEPDIKIVDVWLCRIREKIKNSNLLIETIWGQGYRMTDKPADLKLKRRADDSGTIWHKLQAA